MHARRPIVAPTIPAKVTTTIPVTSSHRLTLADLGRHQLRLGGARGAATAGRATPMNNAASALVSILFMIISTSGYIKPVAISAKDEKHSQMRKSSGERGLPDRIGNYPSILKISASLQRIIDGHESPHRFSGKMSGLDLSIFRTFQAILSNSNVERIRFEARPRLRKGFCKNTG